VAPPPYLCRPAEAVSPNPLQASRGVPQGSVLGPLLFLLILQSRQCASNEARLLRSRCHTVYLDHVMYVDELTTYRMKFEICTAGLSMTARYGKLSAVSAIWAAIRRRRAWSKVSAHPETQGTDQADPDQL
jgi:hypothetical protein